MKNARLLLLIVIGGCSQADSGGSGITLPDGFEELPVPVLPALAHDYAPELPAHFHTPGVEAFDNTPGENPLTDAGATLGRVLFYDVRLSRNTTVSCGSCHQAANGFADSIPLSFGFDGGETGRNSMAIVEERFYGRGSMFWDERAATLEEQVLQPIQNDVEMGLTLDELVGRVRATEFYPALFEDAFGDPKIDADRISRALAQFVRSIVSYQSPWDEGVAQVASIADDFPNYTAQENSGKTIFFGRHETGVFALCGGCHLADNPLLPAPPPGAPPAPRDNAAVFFLPRPFDNGLGVSDDAGFGEVSGLPLDQGAFKAPSLRNIALTAPYMHDGSLATLEEVVDFYDAEIQPTPNLNPVLRAPDGTPLRLHLSADQKAALIAFLGTLTDPTLATEPRFASPFPE